MIKTVITSAGLCLAGVLTAAVPGASAQAAVSAVSAVSAASGAADTWTPGQTLSAGQAIYSADGEFKLIMQGDGNLVEYSVYPEQPAWSPNGTGMITEPGPMAPVPIWAANTAGNPGAWAVMQRDGNLVVYSSSGNPLWASGTHGHPGAYLVVQTDANVVIYSPSGAALWANDTVSFTSVDSAPYLAHIRGCAFYANGCMVTATVPNGTDVVMRCWIDAGWAEGNSWTNRWFFVTVASGAATGQNGFIIASVVQDQIRTPECDTVS